MTKPVPKKSLKEDGNDLQKNQELKKRPSKKMLVSADKATKRRKELEDIAENMVIRPTTLVKSHYKKFKIFSGSLKYSLPNFTEKELKKIEFLT